MPELLSLHFQLKDYTDIVPIQVKVEKCHAELESHCVYVCVCVFYFLLDSDSKTSWAL